jgi:hypothetical protein
MGQQLPAPKPQSVGTFDECFTQNATVQVSIAIPPPPPNPAQASQATVTAFQKGRPPGAVSVAGAGDSAYCFSMGLAGRQLFALEGATVVEVGTDSCAHASALARIVLQHL